MILIADDDRGVRSSLSLGLRSGGYEVVLASSSAEAIDAVRAHPDINVALIDMNYSASTSGSEGLELLRRLRVLAPELKIILMTAWGSIALAVEGMKLGAWDFLTKPIDVHILRERIATAVALSATIEASDHFDRSSIIGHSVALERVLKTAAKVAHTDAPVLILGENGTGKELLASAIHRSSPRSARPFVKVNLGGLPQSLFESELFGHAKGAFTGAVDARKGRFEIADSGTIFLDEIGELAPESQVKLLRVLQEHTFEPLGSSKTLKTDVRVISATNADLVAKIADRSFREDLFYRINLITLHMPPLRERREDIPFLVKHFIGDRTDVSFSAGAIRRLQGYSWPGNVRQLKNVVEKAIIIAQNGIITEADIEVPQTPKMAADSQTLNLEQIERATVEHALKKADGNLSQAAEMLGITRQALYRRIQKYGL